MSCTMGSAEAGGGGDELEWDDWDLLEAPVWRLLVGISCSLAAKRDGVHQNEDPRKGDLHVTNPAAACLACRVTRAVASLSNPTQQGAPGTLAVARRARNLSRQNRSVRFLRRYRVFFETVEGFVAQDKNNDKDVYEWERPGTGQLHHTRSLRIG